MKTIEQLEAEEVKLYADYQTAEKVMTEKRSAWSLVYQQVSTSKQRAAIEAEVRAELAKQ